MSLSLKIEKLAKSDSSCELIELVRSHLQAAESSALFWASSCNKPEILQDLVQAGCSLKKHGDRAYKGAILYGSIDTLKWLQGQNVAMGSKSISGLYQSVAFNGAQGIKELVNAGLDVNAENELGMTALKIAIKKEDFNAIRILIENGANWNNESNPTITSIILAKNKPESTVNLLGYACSKNRIDILEELAATNFPIRDYGDTLLSRAIWNSSMAALKWLLNYGIQMGERSVHVIYMKAVHQPLEELINLQDSGLDIEAKSVTGESAMDIAIKRQSHDALQKLKLCIQKKIFPLQIFGHKTQNCRKNVLKCNKRAFKF